MTTADVDRLRCAAGVAAIVLAALSRGDAIVLALAVIVAAWRWPALAVLPALLASSWRWGSTSLEALAGAQAVLGPAGWVGPASAAAASVLAALAVVLVVPVPTPASTPDVGSMRAGGRSPGALDHQLLAMLLAAAAVGVTAGVIVAGPAAGGDLWIRIAAGVAGTAFALGVARLRRRIGGINRVLDTAAVVAAVAALYAASMDAPGWAGTVDGSAVGEGALVAAAVLTLTGVGLVVRDAMRNRRP